MVRHLSLGAQIRCRTVLPKHKKIRGFRELREPRNRSFASERDCVQAMKINVERGAFLKARSHVQSVVERRNTIPILSNLMLEAG